MVSSIYFAAALFSSRETLFNYELAERLKKALGSKVRVFLPQRDGFEFSALGAALSSRLPEQHVASAVNTIIYTLDIGGFLSRSDAAVAVLDEPLDEGVLVEISYARLLGIPVVGIRSDRRAPFGVPGDALGGIHFFAAYQCTHFVTASVAQQPIELEPLVQTVAETLKSGGRIERKVVDAMLDRATQQLFKNVDIVNGDLHSEETLSRIVDNYAARPDLFERLAPRITSCEPGRANRDLLLAQAARGADSAR